MNNYYVYVYIDPRNFEEFYYGKGKGSRKNAHLNDESEGEKAKRIAAIKKEGLQPIIRVIAKELSEHDALLIEKTLLWKLGRNLLNVAPGHYGSTFRPHDTLHTQLTGFDYQNGIYYYNIGDGPHRCWEDYIAYGFISAGQGERWRDAMLRFQAGDVVAAYLKGHGFVGIGKLTTQAKPVREISINGKPLLSHQLKRPQLANHCDSNDLCEYVALVDWVSTVTRDNAHWKSKAGLYTTTLIRASLDNQAPTLAFLEQKFGVDLRDLIV